jgi:hypothetical protein
LDGCKQGPGPLRGQACVLRECRNSHRKLSSEHREVLGVDCCYYLILVPHPACVHLSHQCKWIECVLHARSKFGVFPLLLSFTFLRQDPRLISNLKSSCFSCLNARITGVYHHACLVRSRHIKVVQKRKGSELQGSIFKPLFLSHQVDVPGPVPPHSTVRRRL